MEIIPNTPQGIDRAALYIRSGKLLVWPSPPSYALSVNGLDPHAVRSLYAAKWRAPAQALVILALGVSDAERYGDLNPVARRLAAEYWPGYLAVIVKRRPASVPDFVTTLLVRGRTTGTSHKGISGFWRWPQRDCLSDDSGPSSGLEMEG